MGGSLHHMGKGKAQWDLKNKNKYFIWDVSQTSSPIFMIGEPNESHLAIIMHWFGRFGLQ